MPNKVLLVWEFIPEETEVYILDLNDKELKTIKKCHGQFINLTNNKKGSEKALDWLNEKLDTDEWKKCRVYGCKKEGAKKQEGTIFIEGQYNVVVSGFIL